MIVPYSKIIGLDVFDLKNQLKIGRVKEIVFQKKDFKISGIILENSFFERNVKVISNIDIVDISPQGVVVKDSDSVSNLKESVRLAEAVKEGMRGVDQKVVTKTGKSLGRVVDLYISAETLLISKIFVKNIFSERIISSNAILEIKKRKIISVPEISTSII
jgi:uncharacterized protein YrrD